MNYTVSHRRWLIGHSVKRIISGYYISRGLPRSKSINRFHRSWSIYKDFNIKVKSIEIDSPGTKHEILGIYATVFYVFLAENIRTQNILIWLSYDYSIYLSKYFWISHCYDAKRSSGNDHGTIRYRSYDRFILADLSYLTQFLK